jgi:hypothetical protein
MKKTLFAFWIFLAVGGPFAGAQAQTPTPTATVGCCQVAWTESAGSAGSFQAAKGVAVLGSVVYVADYSRVQTFDDDGNPISSWPNFNIVDALVVGKGDGLLYAAESGDVRIMNPNGTAAITILGYGGDLLQGISVDPGNGDVYAIGNSGMAYWAQRTNATTQYPPAFNAPQTLNLGAVFSNSYGILKIGSRLFISDIVHNEVIGFSQSGTSATYTNPTTLVGSGSGMGQVSAPMQITEDGSGNIYVVSNLDNRYEEYDPTFTGELHECQVAGSNYFGIGIDADENVFMSGNGLSRIGNCGLPAPVPGASVESFIYPSPARGDQTTLSYSMAQSGRMELKIWNQNGELVDTITDQKAAGAQTTPFKISGFAPGVYFYTVTQSYDSGQTTKTQPGKFVVVR